MKKYLVFVLLMVFLVGCGNSDKQGTTIDTQAQETQQTQETEHTHTYVEEVTTEVTCEVDGLKTFSCECGDSYTEAITAIGHKYEEVEASAVEATCAKEGKEVDTKCSNCGNVVTGAAIPSLAHTYGEYVYNNDASYEADGTESATCSVCGKISTRTKEGTKIVEYPEFPYALYSVEFDGKTFTWYSHSTHEGYQMVLDQISEIMSEEELYGYGPPWEWSGTTEEVGRYKAIHDYGGQDYGEWMLVFKCTAVLPDEPTYEY